MMQTQEGIQKLQSLFMSCSPIQAEDYYYFKWSLAQFLATTAQWQNPPGNQLDQACAIMTRGGDPVANWAYAYNTMNGQNGQCNDFSFKNYMSSLQNVTNTNNLDRSWHWQKCNEFGFFQGSYKGTSVFFPDLPIDELLNWCYEIFGIHLYPDVAWTNAYYGGFNITGTNILFTNGLRDPWHHLSINSNHGDIQAVTYDAGHCAPMTQPTDKDPVSLVHARSVVEDFLRKVLN
eukprot:TRINITY_DN60_c0_g1_i1.p1 TRINITY_DN60_c0_g1~~TRINITY_DN60_c0_g1_i1.p1  ORF type:complete len:233 (+),score=26.50 TRINITY_DN60_c0_g1_i1:103-801(+)